MTWFIRVLGISILLLTIHVSSYAQFGVRAKYNNTGFAAWDTPFNNTYNSRGQMFTNGFEGGIDYWMRLKKKRIEFMPEIAYARHTTSYTTGPISQLTLSDFHFNFHTHIYALDMGNDCDCPTFSKQGGTIDKGLFIHFTPGLSYHNVSGQMAESGIDTPQMPSGVTFRAGIGLGMDIGISDLWTITPIVSYYFRSPLTWENLNGMDSIDVTPNILQLTLRLGFRPDYKRKYGRR